MSRFIEFSNGVKLSEETVVDACKRQGIVMVPPKSKHIFQAGNIVRIPHSGGWRLIVKINNDLYSVDEYGQHCSTNNQDNFEICDYEYVGELKDLIK